MKSIVIREPHDLRLEDRPGAEPPQAGEVRIRISHGGICGSDLHYYHKGGFGTVRLKEPMILGHEASGFVCDVGPGVTGFTAGDAVAINPSQACGTCRYCRSAMRNQCENMRFFGSAMRYPHIQGLFRQELTLPAAQLIRLPPDADMRLIACAEPFAVCLHAARQAGMLLGKRVLVSGCGPIGCLTIVAALHAGAREVVATDVSAAPLKIAHQLGATHLHDLAANPDALAADAEGRGSFDVVFECSGSQQAIATAYAVVRPGGRIVTVGLGGDVMIPLGAAVTKEIEVIGTFRFDEEFAWAVDLIAQRTVDIAPLVTSVVPLAEFQAGFDLASDRTKSMKVQIAF